MSDEWKIAAFYHFVELPDRDEWADRLVDHGLKLGLRGSIILAPEGINSTCSGSHEAVDATIALLREDPRFEGMEVKYSYADFCPFPKFKVKRKPEIVTFRQPGADPREDVGTYLEPEEWNDLRADREVLKIAMYCTGGIRCERSTAYVKSKGFKNVYHLKGGVLRYLELMPKEKSLWEGDCFVFDYRVAVDHDLRPAPWKIDQFTSDPMPMSEEERPLIEERRRSGAIFKKN